MASIELDAGKTLYGIRIALSCALWMGRRDHQQGETIDSNRESLVAADPSTFRNSELALRCELLGMDETLVEVVHYEGQTHMHFSSCAVESGALSLRLCCSYRLPLLRYSYATSRTDVTRAESRSTCSSFEQMNRKRPVSAFPK